MEYGALAVALAILAGLYTVWAYRRAGLGAGLRGAALVLLVLAAYLTRTLRMFGRIVDAVVDWATALVFSPTVWVGIVLAGVAVLLFGASRFIDRRSGGRPAATATSSASDALASPTAPATPSLPSTPAAPAAPAPSAESGGDDFADIEALLKNRGIT